MRIAAVFSGQGAQAQGMGSELYASSDVAKKIYELAGEDIKRYSFHGSKEELSQTIITQPTVYTLSMAAYYSFFDHVNGAKPRENEVVALAGFSLGEFSAYTAAGVFGAEKDKLEGFAKGLDIVRKRAEFMDEAGQGGVSAWRRFSETLIA
jgi:[acyl-carrier-protein] S-malonyltransferase